MTFGETEVLVDKTILSCFNNVSPRLNLYL